MSVFNIPSPRMKFLAFIILHFAVCEFSDFIYLKMFLFEGYPSNILKFLKDIFSGYAILSGNFSL